MTLNLIKTVLAVDFPDRIVPDCDPTGPLGASSTCGACQLALMISDIFDILIASAFIIATVYLVIGGLRLLFSGGSPANMIKARKNITSAIVGFVIVLGAWLIVNTFMVMFTDLEWQGEWYKLGEHLGCPSSNP